MKNTTIGAGLLLLAFSATAEDADVESLEQGTQAVPIERTAPRYPGVELQRGRQGWVELSFVVTTDGKVIDPIVQDSSGSPHFERAARDVVADWTYEPATWNGEVVQQCDNKVLITFAVEDAGKTVSRSFARKYNKINEVLSAGDLDESGEMIDDVFDSKDLTLPEVTWLWALEARRAGLAGDKDRQLAAVRKATKSNGRWVSDELYPSLLLIRTIRELESGNYSAAFSSHEKLLATEAEYPQLEVVQDNIDRLQGVVASNATYSVPAKVDAGLGCEDCESKWSYRLLRHKFSLHKIDGELGNLEIRCARQRVVDTARPETVWEIPESWGACSVIVFGSPGSTFDLHELPEST